jgi:hypothetical protein
MSGPTEGEDILTEEALVFDPSLWIGHQKKYKDVPLHVSNALTQLRQIPEAILSLLPQPEVPILDFISLKLPRQSAELVMVKIDKCFSSEAPQMDIQTFLHRSIPPKSFITAVENSLGQAWFDGKVSFVDPRFVGSDNRLSFWVPTYWRRMDSIIEAKKRWQEARVWLQTESTKTNHPSQLPSERELFASIGWNVPLAKGPGMTTGTLAQFLSNWWLDQEAMELMITHLQKRLAEDPIRRKKAMIASCQFFSVVEDAASKNRYDDKTISSALRNIEVRVKNETLSYLYFPFFGNHHEIAVYINFEERKIGYG